MVSLAQSHLVWVLGLLLTTAANRSSAAASSSGLPPLVFPMTIRPGQCGHHHPLDDALRPRDRYACPTPVDEDAASPPQWGPWTHRPYCVNATATPRVKYCTYTNSLYGEHGISFITRPEVAAGGSVLLDTDMNDLKATASEVARREREDGPPFVVHDVPGKGKGAVARRLIRKWEPFLMDHASVMAAVDFPGSVKQAQGYELLHYAAEQLTEPERVLGLGRSSTAGADIVEDVVRTNSFEFDILGVPHMALFPLVSRINHACNPNSFIHFSSTSPDVSVVAFRDIQPGEEVTISYIPYGLTFPERQQTLRRWGFTCACDMCTASAEERATSDERRTTYAALKEQVVEELKKGKLYMAIKLCKKAIALIQQERLEPLVTEQYETIARIYWALKDVRNAEKFARLALSTLRVTGILDGRDEEDDVRRLLASFDN